MATRRTRFSALTFSAIVLTLAAALVFLPCSISIILASWFALLTRPWMSWLAKRLGGRTTAAALITTMVVIGFLGPAILAVVPIVFSAIQLANEVGQSQQWHDAAQAVVGKGNDADIMHLLRGQMANAWSVVAIVLRTSATALFGIAMFVVSLFALSAHGEVVVAWLREHSPIAPRHFDRMARVYAQTGRGLVIGVGATALIQGVLATITYAVVGIPRALALGLLTTLFAFIPGIGTILVWGPVTVILAMGGYPVKAAIVAVSGVVLIGSVDNFLKPILSHRAHLRLPSVLVFMTMLSGIVAFGPAGLILGPLFVCLAMEILAIVREERKPAAHPDIASSHPAKRAVAPSMHV
jgi:predicted PurR-regulated permease PerM